MGATPRWEFFPKSYPLLVIPVGFEPNIFTLREWLPYHLVDGTKLSVKKNSLIITTAQAFALPPYSSIIFNQRGDKSELRGATSNFLPQPAFRQPYGRVYASQCLVRDWLPATFTNHSEFDYHYNKIFDNFFCIIPIIISIKVLCFWLLVPPTSSYSHISMTSQQTVLFGHFQGLYQATNLLPNLDSDYAFNACLSIATATRRCFW